VYHGNSISNVNKRSV